MRCGSLEKLVKNHMVKYKQIYIYYLLYLVEAQVERKLVLEDKTGDKGPRVGAGTSESVETRPAPVPVPLNMVRGVYTTR